MTFDISVYCKKQPDISNIIERLKLQPARKVDGYDLYVWDVEQQGSRILIALQEDFEIVSGAYDRAIIDESIAPAQFAGIDGLDILVQKFIRDNLTNKGQLLTYTVGSDETSAHIDVLKPSFEESESYTIRADRELYDIVTRCPVLEGLHPWLKLYFGLAKFTEGTPTFKVDFEAKVTASKTALQGMTGLAQYFAKTFDGIVYDSDKDKFELPNADDLHRTGRELFWEVSRYAKKRGGKIKLKDYGNVAVTSNSHRLTSERTVLERPSSIKLVKK